MPKRILTGKVTSNKSDKTITVGATGRAIARTITNTKTQYTNEKQ